MRRSALILVCPLAFTCLALPAGAAPAPPVDAGAFAHCAAITAADERLACYDSLSRPKSNPAPATTPAPAAAKAVPRAAAPAAAATAPGAATATAAAGTAAAASAAPEATAFGLTRHTPPAEEAPNRIEAQVTRVDTDRLGNVHVSLDNGQAWIFNAPDALIRVGDAVTIKRGTLGSFLLTIPSRHTYKAQRTQ
jgi:hypothetical protein